MLRNKSLEYLCHISCVRRMSFNICRQCSTPAPCVKTIEPMLMTPMSVSVVSAEDEHLYRSKLKERKGGRSLGRSVCENIGYHRSNAAFLVRFETLLM